MRRISTRQRRGTHQRNQRSAVHARHEGRSHWRITGYAALAAECRGASVLTNLDGAARFIAGSAVKLYEGASAAWTERTRGAPSSPSNYTMGTAGRCEVLFLDAKSHRFVDESGSSNFFAITRDGTYVTPKSPSILDSVTNQSLIELAKEMGIKVERRPIEVSELPNFVEAGLIGTATIITPVGAIQHGNKLIQYGSPNEVGPVSLKLRDALLALQTGEAPDPHGWTHEIDLGLRDGRRSALQEVVALHAARASLERILAPLLRGEHGLGRSQFCGDVDRPAADAPAGTKRP